MPSGHFRSMLSGPPPQEEEVEIPFWQELSRKQRSALELRYYNRGAVPPWLVRVLKQEDIPVVIPAVKQGGAIGQRRVAPSVVRRR